MPLKPIHAFCRQKHGASTIRLLALPMLVAILALVAELGHGLIIERETKHIADLAAYAAATAYGSTGSAATMISVARNVAVLNGLPDSAVTATLVASSRSSAGRAVAVTASAREVLLVASVLGFGTSFPVSAEGYAEVGPSAIVAAGKMKPLASEAGIRSAAADASGLSR